MRQSFLGKSLLGLAAALTAATAAAEATADRNDQADLSLTIYQQGFALVRDERTIDLPLGRQRLHVLDVSDQIVSESLFVGSQGVVLSGIEYGRATLTPESLLRQSIGREVRVLHQSSASGAPVEETGVLIGAQGDVPIVRFQDRVEFGGPGAPWRLALTDLPASLQGQDKLILELDNQVRGPQSLQLAYLSRGLRWQADYVGLLENESSLSLSGWVTVENNTQASFLNARVQLLAGEPNRSNDVQPFVAMARTVEAAPADMASQPLDDYHLYELPEPLDLLPQQRRQLPLLVPRSVPVEREYRIEGNALRNSAQEEAIPVIMLLYLRNSEPGLGQPLPAGVVRIYGHDLQGRPQFLGEDRLDHTAKDQPIKLRLGTAFDVRAAKTTVDYRRLAPQVVELEQRFQLRNGKSQPVTVVIAERMSGDWEIQSSDHAYEKVAAQLVEWRIELPPESEQTFGYRVRVQH